MLAFAMSVYRKRYGDLWHAFLDLVDAGDLRRRVVSAAALRMTFSAAPRSRHRPKVATRNAASSTNISGRPRRQITRGTDGVIEYRATRLLFLRDVIERLTPGEAFRVITRDHGTFEFTRDAFERTFPNVVASESWRVPRLYHYTQVPRQAAPFRK